MVYTRKSKIQHRDYEYCYYGRMEFGRMEAHQTGNP